MANANIADAMGLVIARNACASGVEALAKWMPILPLSLIFTADSRDLASLLLPAGNAEGLEE